VTSQRTFKAEAARARVGLEEYLDRLGRGQLWCSGCLDWHQAEEFPADARRHTGRGGSCIQAIRAEARAAIAGPAKLPPPAVTWVIRRPEPSSGAAWAYWHGPGRSGGPGRNHAGTWSPALDESVARFPGTEEARAALAAAFGNPGAVPPGCRLAGLA
jgi:hypothetical protein